MVAARHAVFALVIIAALFNVASAHNGMRDIGTTVKQLGRGGAFIATPPDAGALNGNPGALAFLDEAEAYADLRVFIPLVDYTGLMKATGVKQHYLIPNLAYVAPINRNSAWGVGVFSQTVLGAEMKDYDIARLGAPAGTTDRAGAKVRYITLTPGYALKLNPRTGLGVALSYSSGETDEESINYLGGTVGYHLSNLGGKGLSLRAGIYHVLDEDTTLGAFWRSRSDITASGGVVTTGPLNMSPNIQLGGVSVEGSNFPEEYGVGIGHRFGERFTLFSEYRRYKWRPVRETVRIVVPGAPAFEYPMNWSNQNVYVLGGEFRPKPASPTVWRLGVNYGKSPVPDSTLSPMFPTINEFHYTAGWERPLSSRFKLSASAVYAAKHSQTSSLDDTNNPTFGGGEPFSVSAESWEFGLGLTWRLGHKHQCKPACEPEESSPEEQDGSLIIDDQDNTSSVKAELSSQTKAGK